MSDIPTFMPAEVVNIKDAWESDVALLCPRCDSPNLHLYEIKHFAPSSRLTLTFGCTDCSAAKPWLHLLLRREGLATVFCWVD